MSPTVAHEVSIFNFGTVRRMRSMLTLGANPYYLMVDQLIVTLETKTDLVGIATNGCDTFHPKVERLRRKPSLLQERYNEAP